MAPILTARSQLAENKRRRKIREQKGRRPLFENELAKYGFNYAK